MLESAYQAEVKQRLELVFPECVVLKNDSQYIQGIPDLLVLHGPWWAMLEVKTSRRARTRPNQKWWIDELNEMSFAAFIFPENEDEVFYAMERSYETSWATRLPKCK